MASDRMEFKSSLVRLLPRLLPETSKCSPPTCKLAPKSFRSSRVGRDELRCADPKPECGDTFGSYTFSFLHRLEKWWKLWVGFG